MTYLRRHLTPDDAASLFAQALAQAEAAALNAWINHLLAPEDAAREAAYRQAEGRVETLERERERVVGTEGANGKREEMPVEALV